MRLKIGDEVRAQRPPAQFAPEIVPLQRILGEVVELALAAVIEAAAVVDGAEIAVAIKRGQMELNIVDVARSFRSPWSLV